MMLPTPPSHLILFHPILNRFSSIPILFYSIPVDSLSAVGGCEAAVTARKRCG